MLLEILAVSQPVLLGALTPILHEISGTLYAIDEKTFFIQNFRYDGQGVSKFNPSTDYSRQYSYKFIALGVYVYIYLTGQTVDRSGGGTTINWNSTYEIEWKLFTLCSFFIAGIGGPQFHEGGLYQKI